MVEVEFNYNQNKINIQGNMNDKFEEIIQKYINKANLDINNIYFISNGNIVIINILIVNNKIKYIYIYIRIYNIIKKINLKI